MAETVVIGLGNDYRGDDGAGLVTARLLRGLGVPAADNGGDPAELIEAWAGADVAVVIDAARSGEPPGVVRRFHGVFPPSRAGASSHALSLADAVELARVLGRMPGELVVYTVEGATFALGEGLSQPVAAATAALARTIARDLAHEPGP
ncbi:Hydrogenase maturation protease [Nonomuraea coxensis DSM 45129]|uniref:Hydrogenase maturation protease n=1 Tax=Nonomuraea coxensis DSM 45129 TaxID=1122611 RepID=A0ABX8U2F1_9ACTN|nr:hydrogenase maturation protease [Nonomuraea coxensis]QYC41840.1 Hydrogenase maturation protease [Nonomuraea coxensis DSM 45129]